MNDAIYIPSTAEGKTWRLDAYKLQGRPPIATAQEGVKGYHSFEYAIGGSMGDRHLRIPLEGRLTAKAKAAALAMLQAKLKEMGAIE